MLIFNIYIYMYTTHRYSIYMYICTYVYIYIIKICVGVFDPLTKWDAPLVKVTWHDLRWVPGNPLPVKVNRPFLGWFIPPIYGNIGDGLWLGSVMLSLYKFLLAGYNITSFLPEFGASEVAAPTPLPGSGGYEVSERRQAARSPQSQTPSTGGGYLTPYNTQPWQDMTKHQLLQVSRLAKQPLCIESKGPNINSSRLTLSAWNIACDVKWPHSAAPSLNQCNVTMSNGKSKCSTGCGHMWD